MNGGGGADVEYTQSPEARQMMQAYLPMIQGMGQYGTQRYFGGAPNMGAPSMQGALTQTPMYDIPAWPGNNAGQMQNGMAGFDMGMGNFMGSTQGQPAATSRRTAGFGIQNQGQRANFPAFGDQGTGQLTAGSGRPPPNQSPNQAAGQQSGYGQSSRSTGGYDVPGAVMPTGDWWNALAPNVKAGLYAPYAEAGRGMMEAMGSRGQLGAQGAGLSGAAGAGLGKLAGEAAKNVGLNAWQMTSPGLQQQAGMQYGSNRDAWQNQNVINQQMWNADLMRNQQAYQNQQQENIGDYNTQMNVWEKPFGMAGMTPSFMPQGMVQQQQGNPFMQGIGSGLMAYGATGNPWLSAGIGAAGMLGGF